MLLENNRINIAHVGDSRLVVGYIENYKNIPKYFDKEQKKRLNDKNIPKISHKTLTKDHKPDDNDEQKRIRQYGGVVSPGSFKDVARVAGLGIYLIYIYIFFLFIFF